MIITDISGGMDEYRLQRAKTLAVIPRSRSLVRRDPATRVLQRYASVPNLGSQVSLYLDSVKYQPRRHWDLDEYLYDYNIYSRFNWPAYTGRRYYTYEGVPSYLSYPWWYTYPRSSYSTYGTGYLSNLYDYPLYRYRSPVDYDPLYWRTYSDPTRARWFQQRPYVFENMASRRAVTMYRQKLINYDTLEKYWLSPSYYYRRMSDLMDIYGPTRYYSPRRYFYSFYS